MLSRAVLSYAVLCCRWMDLTTTLDGPEVSIFKEACRKNKVRQVLKQYNKTCSGGVAEAFVSHRQGHWARAAA